MYPRLKEGVSIGTFTYEDSPEKHYYAENKDKVEFEISHRVYRELLRADGTHPIRVSKTLLRELKKANILTTSRYVFTGIVSRFVLLPLGQKAQRFQPICRVLNILLPVLAAVLFAASLFAKATCGHFPSGDLNNVLFYLLFLFSIVAHEYGHLISGLSVGYRFSELGLLLLGVIPVGAYVAHTDNQDVRRLAKIQFSLSGIEANLLIAGICLLLSTLPTSLDTTFVMTANINVLLAIINLLPATGLDGESTLSAILGIDSVSKYSKVFLKNKKFRKHFLRAGAPGYVCASAFVLSLISSALVPLLILCDIVCAVLNIFL